MDDFTEEEGIQAVKYVGSGGTGDYDDERARIEWNDLTDFAKKVLVILFRIRKSESDQE